MLIQAIFPDHRPQLSVLLSLLLFCTALWTDEAHSQNPSCPRNVKPLFVDIREADPNVDMEHHNRMRKVLIDCVKRPNTTIRLGPKVLLDFENAHNELPLKLAACVTLTSVAAFSSETPLPGNGCEFRPEDPILERVRPEVPAVAPTVSTQPLRPERGRMWVRLLMQPTYKVSRHPHETNKPVHLGP